MSLLGRKEKEVIAKLQKEIVDLKESNKNYANNMAILQNTIEKVKNVCKASKSGVIGKQKILEQLGEK